MSHFSVIVISDKDLSTGDNLEKILLPFHEYECTGIEEYLVDVDVDEETRQDFEKNKSSYPDMTIEQFAEEWNGAKLNTEGKFIKRTNPNAKWDWWVVGGRWLGSMLPKIVSASAVGRPGTFGNEAAYEGGVDILKKSNLDIEEMRNQAGKEAGETYDRMHLVVGNTNRSFTSWKAVVAAIDENDPDRQAKIDEARKVFHEQAIVKVLNDNKAISFWNGDEQIQDYLAGRDHMVEKGRNNALSSYAVLKDGQWYARGEMGWFGMSSNEVDKDEWSKQFAKLIDETPDDHWLAVVDCHI